MRTVTPYCAQAADRAPWAMLMIMGAQSTEMQSAWVELQSRWDADDAHRRYLALAATLGRLQEAGASYRAVAETDPNAERRAVADTQIQRLVALAMQNLQTLKTERKRPQPKMILLAAGVSISLIASALWGLLGQR